MTFDVWKSEVGKVLKLNQASYTVDKISQDMLSEAYANGDSPVIFAKRSDHRPELVVQEIIPVPQVASVLNDPKYLLDTGHRKHCPVCGSSFIKPLGKSGTGLGYIGSVQWIVAASVFESLVKAGQKQPFQCGYCEATFAEDYAAKIYATEKEPLT